MTRLHCKVQRLTRYPASDSIIDIQEGEIGSGAHTDYGGITILYADGPGLQILKPDANSTKVGVEGYKLWKIYQPIKENVSF